MEGRVFAAPWQSRIFGMAVALNDRGTYDWDDFRRRLVDEIARDPDRDYYGSWLGAFESLLLDARVLSETELARRKAEYASQERDDFV